MNVSSALSRAFTRDRAPAATVWLPGALVLLSAVLPWMWAPAGHVIAGIDTPPNVDFSVLWKTTLHTWDPAPNGGISNFVGYGMFFPYYIVAAHLQALGVSAHDITLGALSFAFAFGALGFYIFARQLRASSPVCALLTIAYTLNLGHTFMAPGSPALFAYAALPWLPLAALWAAGHARWRQIAIGFGFAIASTGLVFLKINPPTYVALFAGGIVLGLLALRARNRRLPFAMLAAFAVGFVLVNAWWIVDFLLGVHIDPAAVTAGLDIQSVIGVSAGSTLAQVLLLGGSWAFDPRYDASPYFAYAEWYRSGAIQFMLALAPACAISALVVFRHMRSALWTLAAILLFVFLDAGYHPPFGWAFLWMFQHVPFFWLFREPLTKFDAILGVVYICAFGFLIPQAANEYRRRVLTGLLVIATAGFIIGGLPLINGSVVRPAIGDAPSFKVQVPAYWLKFAKWANAQNGGRIAMLPQNGHYELLYDWGYLGADIDGMLLRHPFIDITPSAGYTDAGMKDVEMEWYRMLASPATSVSLARFLSNALDIQYVVVRHDVQPTLLSPTFTPEASYLPKLHAIGFNRVRRFGELDVYARACCAQVSKAELHPVPLTYVDAMPVGDWYLPANGDAIYAPRSAESGDARVRWLPSRDFVFGVSGLSTKQQIGVHMWSALGAMASADVARSPGQAYFVAIGSLLSPISAGRVYRWHAEPGQFEGAGHIVAARQLSTQERRGHSNVAAIPTRTYGLLTVRPLTGSCNIVTIDGGADPAHLVAGHNQGQVVKPYDAGYTARVLLNAPNAVSVTPCNKPSETGVPYSETAYAIARESEFVLQAAPRLVTSAIQSGTSSIVLNREAHNIACKCTLSFAAVTLRAADVLRVEVPARYRSRSIRVGVLDASGVPHFMAASPPLDSEPNAYAVAPGKAVIACDCSGAAPTVSVTLEAVHEQHMLSSSSAPADISVASSSETGSEGHYVAQQPSAVVLPQSFSNGWRLSVDGHALPHFSTTTKQNAWILPAGRHAYRVTFWLEDLGSKLQLLAEVAGALMLAGIVAIVLRTRERVA